MLDDFSALLPRVVAIAREAGREILAVQTQDFDVTHKADRSPLTEADLRSHRLIVQALTTLTPDVPILSEESAAVPYAERSRWRAFWLVDPLDGTREFVSRSPEFTVNIALVCDHQPVLGVVYSPARQTSYYAARGMGAFRQIEEGDATALQVSKPAQVPPRVLGSKSHRGNSLDDMLAKLGPHRLIGVGSSLKFCLVAEGSADLYPRLGPTSEWDTAAGQAVVECAGGQVTDLQGRPLRYNARDTLINPDFIAYGDPDRHWLDYF